MKRIKNLHIIPQDKFDKPYIKFINKNFNKDDHYFLIISNKRKYNDGYTEFENVSIYLSYLPKHMYLKYMFLPFEIIRIFFYYMYYFSKSNKIIFHNLDIRVCFFLYIFPTFLKKSYWVIWAIGGDKERKFFFNKKIEQIEKFVQGKFTGYITLMKDEYLTIKDKTRCKGKFFESFSYPSNLYKNINLKDYKKDDIYIQVGNSAQDCNNHLEIFEKLKPYKEKNIKIFCILSYGDEGNKNNVIRIGKEIFGEKFIPIVDFMKFDDYMEFLSKIDIAIFAHNMQKAFGNITSLISMKKTVYLKEEIPTYKVLSELGVAINSFDKFDDLYKLDNKILEKNQQIMRERFSEKKLIEEWQHIFEE